MIFSEIVEKLSPQVFALICVLQIFIGIIYSTGTFNKFIVSKWVCHTLIFFTTLPHLLRIIGWYNLDSVSEHLVRMRWILPYEQAGAITASMGNFISGSLIVLIVSMFALIFINLPLVRQPNFTTRALSFESTAFYSLSGIGLIGISNTLWLSVFGVIIILGGISFRRDLSTEALVDRVKSVFLIIMGAAVLSSTGVTLEWDIISNGALDTTKQFGLFIVILGLIGLNGGIPFFYNDSRILSIGFQERLKLSKDLKNFTDSVGLYFWDKSVIALATVFILSKLMTAVGSEQVILVTSIFLVLSLLVNLLGSLLSLNRFASIGLVFTSFVYFALLVTVLSKGSFGVVYIVSVVSFFLLFYILLSDEAVSELEISKTSATSAKKLGTNKKSVELEKTKKVDFISFYSFIVISGLCGFYGFSNLSILYRTYSLVAHNVGIVLGLIVVGMLLMVSLWRNVFIFERHRTAFLTKSVGGNPKNNLLKLTALIGLIILNLDLIWTGHFTAQVSADPYFGKFPILLSLFSQDTGILGEQAIDEFIYHIGVLFSFIFSGLIGFWMYKLSTSANPTSQQLKLDLLVTKNFGVQNIVHYLTTQQRVIGARVESVISEFFWVNILTNKLHSTTQRLSKAVDKIDRYFFIKVENQVKKLFRVLSMLTQLFQSGDAQWYVILVLIIATAISGHYLMQ